MPQNASCVFCDIISGKIPAPRVYEDSQFICIRDIRPQAKTHLLMIPKEHVASLDEAFPQNSATKSQLIGSLFEAATHVARQEGLLPGGFRSVINTGVQGGQTVFHLHLHLLGGEILRETFG
ncbi:histidine triad nucleotide-binding protein [bacterium]|jgi:histidine triad (HIT) family protein|nr:histidine triad nucleotide-binding protein [bacterium]